MSMETDIQAVVSYGTEMLSTKPEVFEQALKEQGPEVATVGFVVSIINEALKTGKINVDMKVVTTAVILLFGLVDKVLIKGGKEFSKETKMELIQEIIKQLVSGNEQLQQQIQEGMSEEDKMSMENGQMPPSADEIPEENVEQPVENNGQQGVLQGVI